MRAQGAGSERISENSVRAWQRSWSEGARGVQLGFPEDSRARCGCAGSPTARSLLITPSSLVANSATPPQRMSNGAASSVQLCARSVLWWTRQRDAKRAFNKLSSCTRESGKRSRAAAEEKWNHLTPCKCGHATKVSRCHCKACLARFRESQSCCTSLWCLQPRGNGRSLTFWSTPTSSVNVLALCSIRALLPPQPPNDHNLMTMLLFGMRAKRMWNRLAL